MYLLTRARQDSRRDISDICTLRRLIGFPILHKNVQFSWKIVSMEEEFGFKIKEVVETST